MNQLTERIRQARRRGGRRLGFGVTEEQRASHGLLVAAAGVAVEGVDLAILKGCPDHPANAAAVTAARAAGAAIVGIETSPLGRAEAEAAQAAGAAFVVYDPDTALADALLVEKLDYVLRLPDREIEDSELRAVGTLRPALVIVPAVSDPLPVRALIELRRLGLSVGAPIAVQVPVDASRDLLEVLRECGVVVLVVADADAEAVAGLLARIDDLPLTPRRRDDEMGPIVTGVRPESDEAEEFDDDD
jgi:hypothetical protein